MDILSDWVPKSIRLIGENTDERFVVKRGNMTAIADDESDAQLDTYYLIPSRDAVLYALILPAQVEDNLDDVVRSFVLEREPVREGIRVDHAHVKEKGRLKVLACVVREDRYDQVRRSAADRASELSGIIPAQLPLLMHALQEGFRDGLCLFQDDDLLIGFYLKDGFPLAFLKSRGDRDPVTAVRQFLAVQRAPESVPIAMFGEIDGIGENWPEAVTKPAPDSLRWAMARLVTSRQLPVLNLLPMRERKVHRKLWRYVAMAVAVIVLLVHAGLEIQDYRELRREVNSLQENYDVRRKEAMALRKELNELDELRKKENFFSRQTAQKTFVLRVLNELSRLAPNDTYATSITIRDSGYLDFNGKSKDMYRLIRNLNESELFEQVEKKGSSKQGSDGYTAFLVRGTIVD